MTGRDAAAGGALVDEQLPAGAGQGADEQVLAGLLDEVGDTSGVAQVITEMEDLDEVRDLLGDTVAQAFLLLTRRGQLARADLLALTISGVGLCVRAAAYRLSRTAPTDPELMWTGENRAANLGTATHDLLLPVFARLLGGQENVPVRLQVGPDTVEGTADLVAGDLLVELKTAREARVVGAMVLGPYVANRVQALLYGIALRQMGRTIRRVAYIYLDRASGQEYVHVEELDPDAVEFALSHMWQIQAWRDRPDWAPRTERGPGLSPACDECGWLRRCWGNDARPSTTGPQRALGRDVGEVERILTRYVALGKAKTSTDEERELLQTIFTEGSRPGNYGDLRWYRTAGGEEIDAKAAEQALIAAGLPVPMRPRKGQVRIGPAKRG